MVGSPVPLLPALSVVGWMVAAFCVVELAVPTPASPTGEQPIVSRDMRAAGLRPRTLARTRASCARMRAMARGRQTTITGALALALAVAAAPLQVGAAPASEPAAPEPAPASELPSASEIPSTPRAPTFANQDGWTTPKPGPQTSTSAQEPRRWQIRQAPLAGAEASWGPPGGQMPEYAEIVEPAPAKGPPPKGTPRIVAGAILGPAGLGLAIGGIVGATTDVLGDSKRMSVPMIGVGLVASAIGWALFADGVLRRKKFMRWRANGGEVTLAPVLVPGRVTGLQLGLRF